MYTRGAFVTFSLIAGSAACAPNNESTSEQQTRSQPVVAEMSQISEKEGPGAATESTPEREQKAAYICEPNEKGKYPDKLCSSIAKEFLGKLEREKPFTIACGGGVASGSTVQLIFEDGDKLTYGPVYGPREIVNRFAKEVMGSNKDCSMVLIKNI